MSPHTQALAAAAVVLAAVALATSALVTTFERRRSGLRERLRPYGAPEESEPDPERKQHRGRGSLVETDVLKKAVAWTGRLADRQGLTEQLAGMLDQADLPVRPAEALFVYAMSCLLAAALGAALRGVLGALAALVFVGLAPWAFLNVRITRRRAAFGAQLVDMLQLLAGALRAGFSLPQAADAVCEQVGEPMGKELRRALTEERLGRSIDDAFDDLADRMASKDFACAATGIRVQREVGGNLAELLDTIVETMTARARLRREVRALTAEGRISAVIVGALPLAVGAVMYVMNPRYMSLLFHRRSGEIMILGSVVLGLIGFYWMKKTIEIEV